MQKSDQISKELFHQLSQQAPELLMPAGSFLKLQYAYEYGADAAYVGVPLFSLRARENEFNLEELKKSIDLARSLNKKIYVTANIFARNRKLPSFDKQIQDWVKLKPDALIMSDPGLIMVVREKFPEIPIHLSVQANCMNWQGVRFWHQKVGVSRVILSRELALNEIREIKDRVPEVELEAFVHGAICIAFSGRCLMSSYFSYRDANQGVCDNSCREKFHIHKAAPQKEGDYSKDADYFIEDLRNKGEFYQIDEDENGTYIMNSKDLMLIEHLKEIADAGVCSFKVEGRTKTEYYLALVTRAYRQALDEMAAGKSFDPRLADELDKVANRGYHKGFMMGAPDSKGQVYKPMQTRKYTQRFAGLVKPSADFPQKNGYTPIEVRGKVVLGSQCEIIGPNMHSKTFQVSEILNSHFEPVTSAHGGTGIFYFQIENYQAPKHALLSVLEVSPEG